MSRRFALPLAVGLTLIASPAAAQIAVGQLGLVEGGPESSAWVANPAPTDDGTVLLWWVNFFHPPAESDGLDRAAFLYEVDCDGGRLRRRAHELYAGERLLRANHQDLPWHEPVARWAESEVIAHACGRVVPTVLAPDADAASRHFRRGGR